MKEPISLLINRAEKTLQLSPEELAEKLCVTIETVLEWKRGFFPHSEYEGLLLLAINSLYDQKIKEISHDLTANDVIEIHDNAIRELVSAKGTFEWKDGTPLIKLFTDTKKSAS